MPAVWLLLPNAQPTFEVTRHATFCYQVSSACATPALNFFIALKEQEGGSEGELITFPDFVRYVNTLLGVHEERLAWGKERALTWRDCLGLDLCRIATALSSP